MCAYLEPSMGGVILEHVDHVVKGDEGIVDGHNIGTLVQSGSQDQSANSSKTVDSDLNHVDKLISRLFPRSEYDKLDDLENGERSVLCNNFTRGHLQKL